MSAVSVTALRELLEKRFPGAQPVAPGGTAEPVSTGVAALDDTLPGGGLPRGRLSLWRPGGGATAVLRGACAAAVARGERAVWVDGAGTVAGVSWPEGSLLVRPVGWLAALECGEALLRSGGFALVVVSGGSRPPAASAALRAPPAGGAGRAHWRRRGGRGLGAARRAVLRRSLSGRRAAAPRASSSGEAAGRVDSDALLVRLSRAAREGGAALVVLAERSPVAALRVESRIRPEDYVWRRGPFGEPAEVLAVRVRVRATSPGWSGAVAFELPVIERARRVALKPGLMDRRGARVRP